MAVKVETVETNKVKLTMTISAESFDKALDTAFKKVSKNLAVPGFRKGKMPRQMFEQKFGVEALYEDALEVVLPGAYMQAIQETNIAPVAAPSWDIEQIGKGQELIASATVVVKPEVELGQYAGIEVEKLSTDVTEEDIQSELNGLLERQAEIVVKDGAVENGDTAVIDYEGFKDGVAFEGGKGENHPLVIGSNSFIPGFEEQLIGMTAGEEKEINVTFPEAYHSADLAGAEATFKVKVHEVKTRELPQLDDEFVKDLDRDGIETVEELKADLEKVIKERKETAARNHVIDTVVEKATENAKFDIPVEMIDAEVAQMVKEAEQRFQMQGFNLDLYFQFTGTDLEGFKAQLRPEAEKRLSYNLTLEAIVKAENIDVTEEEVDAKLVEIAGAYGRDVQELKAALPSLAMLKEDLKVQKAVDFIVEKAICK
ncbi:trigger factor [Turicibacter sanguinis]|jgi:trigger factor|uniref:trigger factor n=1 Tax=Turicibacter sanguinis TaxID=154288 RepID=UPI0012BC8610|nr:trigger factor [Turicibacter sanguinis]MDB8554150.1 trigger factor [Turicibacter sanguinis]MDB8557204.1 trigger factor [Turicibacter sanguinis]MDB8559977.1 trigger factor [Turicibacter sanguinis]MTN81158.1 trigger factor [Turicibacter sanguinis]MTN84345.1 trigger factor [Turicibacter sanguinis]